MKRHRQIRIWDLDPSRMSARATAGYFGVSPATLRRWNEIGTGPVANRAAGPKSTFYLRSDVEAFGIVSGLHPVPDHVRLAQTGGVNQ